MIAEDRHEGYIEKQSPSFHKRWQKRYFVLDNRVLKYYKLQSDFLNAKPPKGVLNFQQIHVEPGFKDLQFKIDLLIMGSTRVFNLKCSDQDSFEVWQKKLRHSINSSIGKLKGLTMSTYQDDISKYFDFWRFLRIDETIFKY